MSCNHKNNCCSHGCSSNGCNHHQIKVEDLPKEEVEFLMHLAQYPFLPVVRLIMKSSQKKETEVATLAPVFLDNSVDSLEKVKAIGKVLYSLRYKGFITIDYDKPLENGGYIMYEKSIVYDWFVKTVVEAGKKNDVIYDLPVIEKGSIALTMRGQEVIEEL